MSNTNAQHLGYSPQLGRLTPEDFRSQSQLDRLSDFLRSLVLIPGQGMQITREGSAGTVLSSAESGFQAPLDARLISIIPNGSNWDIIIPTLTIHIHNASDPSTITGITFAVSSLPTQVWLTSRGGTGFQWVHNSTGGLDATTTNQYMTLDSTKLFIAAYIFAGVTQLFPVPYKVSYGIATRYKITRPTIILESDNIISTSQVWYNSAAAAITGTLNYSISGNVLTDGSNNVMMLAYPDTWYSTWANSGTPSIKLYNYSSLAAGNMYFNVGSIALDASGNITSIIGPSMPLAVPMSASSYSVTYSKPVGTGTVTSAKGAVTSIT